MHTSVILKNKGLKTLYQKNSHNAINAINGHKTFNIYFYFVIFSMKFYLSKGFEQYLPVFHIFLDISLNNGLRAIA